MHHFRAHQTLTDILHKAEGARGGHIIGHYRTSGKPIYASGQAGRTTVRSHPAIVAGGLGKLASGGAEDENTLERVKHVMRGDFVDHTAAMHRAAGDAHFEAAEKLRRAGRGKSESVKNHDIASGFHYAAAKVRADGKNEMYR